MSFLDWTCHLCQLSQTTTQAAWPVGGMQAVPCARCRTLHAKGQGVPIPLPLTSPNGAPVVVGPVLFAKMTQPVSAAKAAATAETDGT
jgi:hypothetical protein